MVSQLAWIPPHHPFPLAAAQKPKSDLITPSRGHGGRFPPLCPVSTDTAATWEPFHATTGKGWPARDFSPLLADPLGQSLRPRRHVIHRCQASMFLFHGEWERGSPASCLDSACASQKRGLVLSSHLCFHNAEQRQMPGLSPGPRRMESNMKLLLISSCIIIPVASGSPGYEPLCSMLYKCPTERQAPFHCTDSRSKGWFAMTALDWHSRSLHHILLLPQTSCVTLARSLLHSVPQFPHLLPT